MRFLLYVVLRKIFQIVFLFHEVTMVTASTATLSSLNKCGKLELQHCKTKGSDIAVESCFFSTETFQFPNEENSSEIHALWTSSNVSRVLHVSTSHNCHLTLCDNKNLMGYCAQFSSATEKDYSEFAGILQSRTLSVACSCKSDTDGNTEDKPDEHFDRNYVGVVYSPYDKYWGNGSNGTKPRRVSWQDYTEDEMRISLQTIEKKFSHISTFGIGTRPNTTKWYEGDMIAFVPKIAAEINLKLGYPALRAAIGIFRKDDVNLEWNSRELLNAVDAAKFANEMFNGTVWGITVTSQYATDAVKARDAIEMIHHVKNLSDANNLQLKIGIRLDTCSEFVATKRPEDDIGGPTYFPVEGYQVPLTRYQSSLQEIAQISDYILCITFPPSNYAQLPMPSVLEIMQKEFLSLKLELKKVNPNLKLIIETGVPSEGIGNGFKNSLHNLRMYWYSMAKFAKKEQLMFHLFEATDQPWKNIQDNVSPRFDLNGPNGTDAHFGWWRRANNSFPPVYIEKILEDKQIPASLYNGNDEDNEIFGNLPPMARVLIGCVLGFVGLTFGCLGYLWWKLRKARRDVISRAYVEQFHRGGEQFARGETDYAVALRMPYDRKYELAKESFHIDKTTVIGSGQSGVVFQGTILHCPNPVAFKCTTSSSTVVDIKSIMTEIKILSLIGEHENIVCILGAYTRKIQRGIVYVALEYCSMGNLEQFLRQIPSKTVRKDHIESDYVDRNELEDFCISNPGYVTTAPAILNGYICSDQIEMLEAVESQPNSSRTFREIDLRTMLQWSYQIASAMEYVSAKNVVHADLAARNVLLASLDQVKISDFGLSRKQYQDIRVTHDKDTPLPWRWMAPESLRNLVFSAETDIWSYGVTIWEIFSLAEVPYHGISYDMKFVQQLEKGIRLPQARLATTELHAQLLRCWSISPTNRPTFTDLLEFFETLTECKSF